SPVISGIRWSETMTPNGRWRTSSSAFRGCWHATTWKPCRSRVSLSALRIRASSSTISSVCAICESVSDMGGDRLGQGGAGRRVHEKRRDSIQGQLPLGAAVFPRGTWHAVDHAGGLVLCKGRGTEPAEAGESVGTVAAHARQDACDGVRCDGLGYRF